MKLVQAVKKQQLRAVRRLYLTAFPRNERKPFWLILKKRRDGVFEILAIESDSGEFQGLAVTIHYKDMVLLDYFAIEPQNRGGGVGSTALKLIQERYAGKRLLLEIESTQETCADLPQRERRKAFYLRNSMQVMPYTVELFGVNMEILTYACTVSFAEYHEIFERVFSAKAARYVKQID